MCANSQIKHMGVYFIANSLQDRSLLESSYSVVHYTVYNVHCTLCMCNIKNALYSLAILVEYLGGFSNIAYEPIYSKNVYIIMYANWVL